MSNDGAPPLTLTAALVVRRFLPSKPGIERLVCEYVYDCDPYVATCGGWQDMGIYEHVLAINRLRGGSEAPSVIEVPILGRPPLMKTVLWKIKAFGMVRQKPVYLLHEMWSSELQLFFPVGGCWINFPLKTSASFPTCRRRQKRVYAFSHHKLVAAEEKQVIVWHLSELPAEPQASIWSSQFAVNVIATDGFAVYLSHGMEISSHRIASGVKIWERNLRDHHESNPVTESATPHLVSQMCASDGLLVAVISRSEILTIDASSGNAMQCFKDERPRSQVPDYWSAKFWGSTPDVMSVATQGGYVAVATDRRQLKVFAGRTGTQCFTADGDFFSVSMSGSLIAAMQAGGNNNVKGVRLYRLADAAGFEMVLLLELPTDDFVQVAMPPQLPGSFWANVLHDPQTQSQLRLTQPHNGQTQPRVAASFWTRFVSRLCPSRVSRRSSDSELPCRLALSTCLVACLLAYDLAAGNVGRWGPGASAGSSVSPTIVDRSDPPAIEYPITNSHAVTPATLGHDFDFSFEDTSTSI